VQCFTPPLVARDAESLDRGDPVRADLRNLFCGCHAPDELGDTVTDAEAHVAEPREQRFGACVRRWWRWWPALCWIGGAALDPIGGRLADALGGLEHALHWVVIGSHHSNHALGVGGTQRAALAWRHRRVVDLRRCAHRHSMLSARRRSHLMMRVRGSGGADRG
jgi:hypothetical protein